LPPAKGRLNATCQAMAEAEPAPYVA